MADNELTQGGQQPEEQPVIETVSPKNETGGEEELELKPRAAASESSAGYVHVRFSKRFVWSIVIMLVVIVFGMAAWRFKLYQRGLDLYNTTSVTVKVKEDNKFALQGALFSVNGTGYSSDDNGTITISKIVAGTYPVTISKDGYQDSHATLTISRGDNDIKIFSITKQVAKLYNLKGVVQDYVTGTVLVNVQVSTNGQTVQTNPAGEFTFTKLAAGDYTLTVSKGSYLDLQQKTTVTSDPVAALSVALVPARQVVFVSNRDGKRAVYVSNFDGSNQHQLVPPANGGEDYAPVVSPDGKWIVFSSTRDGLKTAYGSPAPKLYVASSDGKILKKVSDDVAENRVVWASNSTYFYYEGYSDLKLSLFVRHFYILGTNTIFDLGTGQNVTLGANGIWVAYSAIDANGELTITTLNPTTGDRVGYGQKVVSSVQNLAFVNNDTAINYEAFVDNAFHRYQMKISDNTITERPADATDTRVYYPSPNGTQKVFVEERDGKTDLFLIGSDGKEVRLTSIGIVSTHLVPRWDSSGEYIVVGFQKTGENALYVVGLNAADPKKIVDYYDDQSTPYTY